MKNKVKDSKEITIDEFLNNSQKGEWIDFNEPFDAPYSYYIVSLGNGKFLNWDDDEYFIGVDSKQDVLENINDYKEEADEEEIKFKVHNIQEMKNIIKEYYSEDDEDFNNIKKEIYKHFPEIEDSKKVRDEEQDDVTKVCKLLGEAHDKIMEALDLVEELENQEILSSNARYDLEDLEASASDFDFMGENDPRAAFMEKYEEHEYPDDDDMYDLYDEVDVDDIATEDKKEEIKTKEDLFYAYINSWSDCEVDEDDLYRAFKKGLNGKDLPNTWYDEYMSDDMDYLENINEVGKGIAKNGLEKEIKEFYSRQVK